MDCLWFLIITIRSVRLLQLFARDPTLRLQCTGIPITRKVTRRLRLVVQLCCYYTVPCNSCHITKRFDFGMFLIFFFPRVLSCQCAAAPAFSPQCLPLFLAALA